ncbi:penicillin acylase family protein [Mitsuaria sp. GD03876]|uniref:penicillin acylase family protein n=1 Tax=Mitsuaria sp. GD03876 TaxID=2975399 RepID=UPI0024497AE9|nr:penicillin acylase family protein [Mitsuaria sp. GD03876]MDH0865602.1 penicillin acylase family protein [Mitsuaria sp. GD03876]
MRRWSSWRRFGVAGLLGAGGLTLALSLTGVALMRASLPQLDGELRSPGVTQPVVASRDDHGVPAIVARSREDAAYATGFLHAQDRFFQMDLLRRSAAGELAALFGENLLDQDRASRVYRFRDRAEAAVAALAPAERELLARYVGGVNAGLASLRARPFEYLVLGEAPKPWTAADSLLVIWAMYLDLQGEQEPREVALRWLRDHATAEQLAVLMPPSSPFDAPMDADEVAAVPAAMPASGPAWFGPAGGDAPRPMARAALPPTVPPVAPWLVRKDRPLAVGSNGWVVAGSRASTGAAVMANDMHLTLRLPNTWYRLSLSYPASGHDRRLVGVTLPGVPMLVAGSNGDVAWGFTNSYGRYVDLVDATPVDAGAGRFRVAGREVVATPREQRIEVRGGDAVTVTTREIDGLPLREIEGRQVVVRWTALLPGAVDLGLSRLESATGLDDALSRAATAGIPAQNILIAARDGRVGWTLAGALPDRWAEAGAAANAVPFARLPADAHPRRVDPGDGVLSSGNQRQLAGPAQALIGDGGADLGPRGRQIRTALRATSKPDEAALHALQLDDRAEFMALWRAQALAVLDERQAPAGSPRAEFRSLLQTGWTGRADASSVGYRLARAYMDALGVELFGRGSEALARLPGSLDYQMAVPRWPAVAQRLIAERPAGWLRPGVDWDSVQLAAVDRAIATLRQEGPMAERRWGDYNRSRIEHPLAMALPGLDAWLRAPQTEMPGDEYLPRVSGAAFGQSERLVVAPGREERGLFNMPGGQSGHPLSDYFLAGHADWVAGKPLPLLPGPARHVLTFTPG